jgi:hypothetical protein
MGNACQHSEPCLAKESDRGASRGRGAAKQKQLEQAWRPQRKPVAQSKSQAPLIGSCMIFILATEISLTDFCRTVILCLR